MSIEAKTIPQFDKIVENESKLFSSELEGILLFEARPYYELVEVLSVSKSLLDSGCFFVPHVWICIEIEALVLLLIHVVVFLVPYEAILVPKLILIGLYLFW